MIYIADIECNGFLYPKNKGDTTVTKIHCLSVKPLDGAVKTLTGDYKTFLGSLEDGDTLVFHNGFGYDYPVLQKLGVIDDWDVANNTLTVDGIVKSIQHIDTLALSREWFPDHPVGHSLEAWAKKLGTYKPEIEDWDNLPIEEYVDRCENDVITTEKVLMFLADKLGVGL